MGLPFRTLQALRVLDGSVAACAADRLVLWDLELSKKDGPVQELRSYSGRCSKQGVRAAARQCGGENCSPRHSMPTVACMRSSG